MMAEVGGRNGHNRRNGYNRGYFYYNYYNNETPLTRYGFSASVA